jgi:Protein of unknown function (DUF3455)
MPTPPAHRLTLAAVIATTLAACASAPVVAPPDVPSDLRPAAGQELFLEARASGVQIYECAAPPDRPTAYAWTFRAPEATLVDRHGRVLGKHYAGPTWESADGSSVVGEVRARNPGPTSTAIPWLLLAAKSTSGAGVLNATTSIQRVYTAGGIAPSAACSTENAAAVERVPYTASYFFYRAGRR